MTTAKRTATLKAFPDVKVLWTESSDAMGVYVVVSYPNGEKTAMTRPEFDAQFNTEI